MNDDTTPRPSDGSSGERAPHAEPRGRLPFGTPRQFGRYETWRVLGSGAFGRVYLAHDALMGRYVAIKSPKDPLPPDAHRAFLREARVIADIHHPNVCPVHDVGVQDELPYIVMRYVGGGTLNDLIARDPPTPAQALRFAEQIANGLEEAHAHGICHRDLKPANVLYDDKARKLLLTDFGLARWLESSSATTGGVNGTPAYMAPEQWGPGGPFGTISVRTDVYCLGVMLFQLLTGARLFDGTAFELMGHHCQTPPRRPSEVRPALDARLDALCLKALAKQQSERYGSAKEFADAIADRMRPSPVVAPPPPAQVAPEKWQIALPGVWYSAPAGTVPVKWEVVTRTPDEVTRQDGTVYRLNVSMHATDESLAGLVHLESFRDLHTLDLGSCNQITDAGLVHLQPLSDLYTLDLRFCPLTDAGLPHVTPLVNLQRLFLMGCDRITDAGLIHLRPLVRLRLLDLRFCKKVTDEGITALKRTLPNCHIER